MSTTPVRQRAPGLDEVPGAPRRGWRGAGLRSQIVALSGRSLRALVLNPRMLAGAMLGPLLLLVVFSQVFGTVASSQRFPAGVSYVDFLVPALLVTTAMQAASYTSMGLTYEMRSGIIARFRSLPVWLGSVLVARSIADLVRSGLQMLVLLLVGAMLFGFRPSGGIAGVTVAWLLALVVGGAVGWIFIAVACWARHPELTQMVTGVATFPLMFASNAFVPLEGLPGWLQAAATVNPLTYGIEASRALCLGEPAAGSVAGAVVASLLLVAVVAPIAVRGFRRPL